MLKGASRASAMGIGINVFVLRRARKLVFSKARPFFVDKLVYEIQRWQIIGGAEYEKIRGGVRCAHFFFGAVDPLSAGEREITAFDDV